MSGLYTSGQKPVVALGARAFDECTIFNPAILRGLLRGGVLARSERLPKEGDLTILSDDMNVTAGIFMFSRRVGNSSRVKGDDVRTAVETLKAFFADRRAEIAELSVTIPDHPLIATASFRAMRGYTYAAVLCDEVAFWRDDASANPDEEILAAIRPGLANIPGALLLLASSPTQNAARSTRPSASIMARTAHGCWCGKRPRGR